MVETFLSLGHGLLVALLLPVTFKLDPTGSIIMFAGIYFGGMYGSSTTAILLNTPGEAASIATAIEGHAMARAGRGGPALATAAIGSFVAGTLATTGLALLAPWLVELAVRFGPWDYFGLMVLAFVTVSATFGDSVLRGLVGLILGPMAESQFRRSLQMSLGDGWVFLKHPGSATLLALAVVAMVAPLVFQGLRRFKAEDA